MRRWNTVAWTAAIVAACGIGMAVGPVAHGQGRPVRIEPAPRAFEFASGGSWIGVSVREVTDADLSTLELPAATGAVVDDVTRDSPAATAGIKTGDVIVEFDGETVRGTRHLTRLVQETPAGRKIQTAVVRDGQRVQLSVQPDASRRTAFMGDFGNLDVPDIARIWAMPAPPAPPAAPSAPRPAVPPTPPAPPARGFFGFDELIGRGSGRLGVVVQELTPQLADYFGVREGVLVVSVTSGSAAETAGVTAGDVITTLNGAAVSSSADLRQRSLRLDEGAEVTLGVTRDKKTLTLKGKVEGSAERRRTRTVL
ncbi:MAG: PDZ domain-containing protein [Vicinamibacterales bacterium]